MLKKLEKRIRLLLIIPLTLLIILICALSIYMNYDSTMSMANESINRNSTAFNDEVFSEEGQKGEVPHKDEGDAGNHKPEDAGARQNNSGTLYELSVENGEITYQSIDNDDAASTALSLANGNERDGMYKGYFYRLQKTGNKSYTIKLLRDADLYNRFYRSFLIVMIVMIIGILLLVFVAFALSKTIIKPVAENEEKQRRFISDTSHELKTPLAVIAVNADMQEAETGKTKWLTYIQNETESMEKLISRLLLLSSSENKDISNYSTFDISARSEMCVSAFEAMAYEKGVSIISAVTPDISFYGNEDDIEHIISPLVDNAIKHTPKGGKIWFTLTEEKNEVMIRVRNEGEPIPDEDINKIFDRFYRVDKARNRSEKRFGLGLPIVKSEVEKYNGRIDVNCQSGLTTFTAYIKSGKKKIK
ncbi:sensor histidine kinase [Ruminococcus sp.]|uniref:sensor histidine kinase n=1 Tax=Ruminococcus sp. TaxID=41978 RepID=UPI00388E2546